MNASKTDVFSSVALNFLTVFMYFKFLLPYFDIIGIIYIYLCAIIICIYIYCMRNKAFIVDATLGAVFILIALYIMLMQKSLPLLAALMSIVVIIFSVSTFYFDWKKLDQR